jgi:hypothetical protein
VNFEISILQCNKLLSERYAVSTLSPKRKAPRLIRKDFIGSVRLLTLGAKSQIKLFLHYTEKVIKTFIEKGA